MFDKLERHRKPTFGYAVFVISVILAVTLALVVFMHAPIEPAFFLIWLVMFPLTMYLGYTYEEITEAAMDSIKGGLEAMLIVLAVGAMIGTWIAAGTVPTIIYYGLQFISPDFFLLSAFVLCSLVSLACGTSWGTLGTAGIAMYAVGLSMGIPPGITLGAIISGSYLGDMASPMSDSTNVAAAATGCNLIFHCKQLAMVAFPVAAVTGFLYYIIGTFYAADNFDSALIVEITEVIGANFSTGIVALVPAAVLIGLLVAKKPALGSMLFSAFVGAVVAVVYQGQPLEQAIPTFWEGFVPASGHDFIDTLLRRGGVMSMVGALCMMMFGFGLIGALRSVGILDVLIQPIASKVKSIRQLTFVTQLMAYLTDSLGSNYFSLIVTGSMMSPLYKKFGLHPSNLSKAMNGTSTILCATIPWNVSGIFVLSLYGLPILSWLPWALFSYLMPIGIFLFVLFNISVVPADVESGAGQEASVNSVNEVAAVTSSGNS